MMNGSCTDGTYCDIYAWCPMEDDSSPAQIMLSGVENFTIFAKVNIAYPRFNAATSNAEYSLNSRNLFSVDTMLRKLNPPLTLSNVQRRGAVLLGTLDYSCDLNSGSWQNNCQPEFKFMRIDTSNFSSGFNYRRIVEDPTSPTRKLYKLWGIRVIFHVHGMGGKFNVVPLFTAIGAGMALMSIATIITDFVLQHLMPNKNTFQKLKFQQVGKGGTVEPLLATPYAH